MAIINVKFRSAVASSVEKAVDNGTTVRSFLETEGIDYASGGVSLDGAYLGAGELDRTFASFGITDHCFLVKAVKADGGSRRS